MKILGAVIVVMLASAASAQSAGSVANRPRTALLADLAACRELPDDRQRLACFDRTATRLDEAEQRGELVVADRADVRRSKRDQFGLTLSGQNPFARASAEPQEEIREITSTIASAYQANRVWIFVLADGGRWRQIDVRSNLYPTKGDKVVVRRAALGSYMLKVGDGVAVRVQRIN